MDFYYYFVIEVFTMEGVRFTSDSVESLLAYI